jgi:hypothetical protein
MRIPAIAFLFLFVIMVYGDASNRHEVFPKSHISLANSISAESEGIIMKILSTGYIPTSEEFIQLHFCNIGIEKNGHLIEIDINGLSQIIQSEISASSSKYSLSSGLKRVYDSVIYKEISESEMKVMKSSIEKPKK